MTEVEWLKCAYPSDMLLWLTSFDVPERKVLLLLVSAWGDGSEEYSQVSKALITGFDQFVEGVISREQLDSICRRAGAENGAPVLYTAENAHYWLATSKPARRKACQLIRDIFGNPFCPTVVNAAWLTSDVLALARQMYESRDFSAMPILADALQDAGCDSADILDHCRGPGPHVRGCWVVDSVLGKE